MPIIVYDIVINLDTSNWDQNRNDVAEVEEVWEPEFTHHDDLWFCFWH